jgi:hypothetical protein
LLEQAALLKVAVAEELIDGTPACGGGEPRRLGPIADERLDRGTEGGKIGRLVNEQAVLVIVDLVDDAGPRCARPCQLASVSASSTNVCEPRPRRSVAAPGVGRLEN